MTLGHGWDWGIFNFLWPWIISWWHLWTCAPRFPGLSKSSYDPAGLFPFPLDAGPRSEDQAEDWCRRESCKFKTLQTPKHCAQQKTIIIKVISPALQPNSRFQASRVLFQLLGSAKNDAPPTDIIYVPMISMFFLWLTREFTTRSAASDGPWLSTGVTPWATWLLARSKFQLSPWNHPKWSGSHGLMHGTTVQRKGPPRVGRGIRVAPVPFSFCHLRGRRIAQDRLSWTRL